MFSLFCSSINSGINSASFVPSTQWDGYESNSIESVVCPSNTKFTNCTFINCVFRSMHIQDDLMSNCSFQNCHIEDNIFSTNKT